MKIHYYYISPTIVHALLTVSVCTRHNASAAYSLEVTCSQMTFLSNSTSGNECH